MTWLGNSLITQIELLSHGPMSLSYSILLQYIKEVKHAFEIWYDIESQMPTAIEGLQLTISIVLAL